MKLLWNTELNIEKTSPCYYRGEIMHHADCVVYHFTNNTIDLAEVKLTFGGDYISSKIFSPNDIRFKSSKRKNPTHYTIDSFSFGEYIVSHIGEWGYQCHKNGQLLWTKSLRGYLYTDIELIGENIVFGTSGFGGHFYSLNLNSGVIVFDINTKGTSQFYFDGFFYVCNRNSKCTDLIKITTTGEIIENIRLDGLYYDYECPFNKCGDILYVVTLKEIKKDIFKPIINCISISKKN